ncbi:hypothetical protein H072_6002 [Dactylellina haptotyla CBS 200.50]|uniref:Clr5 domain-containing protein n=1 Tax=Dactylellina haptotyla (strain CBS 200.50) TaxID=1284197 RepID=S8ABC1_DACHA|nr:hypothetical protein H072_6002 [Dactylellina haptotyla CBS 200.50]
MTALAPRFKHKAAQISQGVWERHKEYISYLYLEERKTLKDVRAIMFAQHDFDASFPDINFINNDMASTIISNPTQWLHETVSLTVSRSFVMFANLLKHYIIRLSNSVDNIRTQRQCIDCLVQSSIMKQNIPMLKRFFQEAKDQNSKLFFTSSSVGNPSGFQLILQNFSVQLLYSAARTGDLDIAKFLIRWLDLDNLYLIDEYNLELHTIGVTAIQYAIEYQQLAVCTFLLKQGFDVNVDPISDVSPSLLWTAILVNLPELVSKLLYEHGALEKIYDLFIFGRTFLESIWNLRNQKLGWAKNLKIPANTDFSSIVHGLQFSVWIGHVECFQVLAEYHHQRSTAFPRNADMSDLLCLATAKRDHEMMERIMFFLDNDIDKVVYGAIISSDDYSYYTALSKAIENRDLGAINILTRSGAKVENVWLPELSGSEIRALLDPQFRVSLEKASLFKVIDRIEALFRSRNAEETLQMRGSTGGDNLKHLYISEAWSWSHKFRDVARNISELLGLLKCLMDEDLIQCDYLYPKLELLIRLYSNFLEWVTVRVETSNGNNEIDIIITGRFLNSEKLAAFPRVSYRFFRHLWDSSLANYDFDCYFKQNYIQLRLNWVNSWSTAPIKDILESYPRKDEIDRTSEGDNLYDPLAASQFLSKLEEDFISHLEDIEQILECSLIIQDKEFHHRLSNIAIANFSYLSESQVMSLLRLAAHCDFYDIAKSVLEMKPDLKITTTVISEATWFGGLKIFNLLLDCYIGTGDLKPGQMLDLETPLYLAVTFGQLYKVIELLRYANVDDPVYGGTILDIAVKLGNLDVTTILLQEGMGLGNLDHSLQLAFDAGNFHILNLLNNAERKRNSQIEKENTVQETDQYTPSPLPNQELAKWNIVPEEYLFNKDDYSQNAFSNWTFPNDVGNEMDCF